jgi:hypothetical protein
MRFREGRALTALNTELNERLQELIKEARKADSEDRQRADLFEAMIRSEHWKVYSSLLASRLQSFSDILLSPAGSVDGAMAQEFVKGAMFGLVLARDLPGTIISTMRAGVPEDEDTV